MQSRIKVTGIAKILQTCWYCPFQFCPFCLREVLGELNLLGWSYNSRGIARRCADEHENLIGLHFECCQLGVVFQFLPVDNEGLAIRFDIGNGVQLELECFAIGGGVEFDVVLFALVLDNDYLMLAGNRDSTGLLPTWDCSHAESDA